ncbi:SDR family oxidoreductase [Pseudomonas sp. UM16]|uniref:SDR family oxidoreductase n=1 Tax=Pseudomonas sp. UM16 TaxID=3158962 RepID=UPI00398FF795
MKIVVIGGTGLIGTQLCNNLRAKGHKVLAASPQTGVNALTGEGLEDALTDAQVVVDVANSPSFEDAAVLAFFQTCGRNLFTAEKLAGVGHHIALSVVGTERMLDSGYFRAKMAQEELIKHAGVPYTILRATQFFEFMGAIAYSGAEGNQVRLTTAALQPVASFDVAQALAELVEQALAELVEQAPANRTVEVAGPERKPLVDFVRSYLAHHHDAREVIADPQATYFGAPIDDRSLTPAADARLGTLNFHRWLANTPV